VSDLRKPDEGAEAAKQLIRVFAAQFAKAASEKQMRYRAI
jgi:hypothetical protein